MNRLLVLQTFCREVLLKASSPRPHELEHSPPTPSSELERSSKRSPQSANSARSSTRLVAVGSRGCRIGEDSQVAKYTNAEIEQIFALRDEGYSYRQIATMLDMPRSTVWAVAAGLMRGKVVDHWEKRECKN